jgi:hypothetical protein
MNSPTIKIAILDLYEGTENQGMRCLREIIHDFSLNNDINVQLEEFEIRLTKNIPSLDFDIYISSGGPGSPLDSIDAEWENAYYNWIRKIEDYNKQHSKKKSVFFICHSFQLACRYFNIAKVTKRKSTSFGVFPVHIVSEHQGGFFEGLSNPFYAVDNRDYQVVEANESLVHQIGASIIAIEKERPHVPFERAIMAVQFNENMIGTQFHPEADPLGMTSYLLSGEKKKMVIENHGMEKWQSMIDQLNDPEKIMLTYSTVLPKFLENCLHNIQKEM